MSNQILSRVFSGIGSNKYPTIGKFVPSILNQQVVVDSKKEEDEENALNTLDQLVTQTLVDRSNALQASQNVSTVPSRAKELLPDQNSAYNENLTNEKNSLVEQAVEQTEQSKPAEQPVAAEVAPNPELTKLSQELREVSKETKEQREQAEISEKQKEINNLAQTITTPLAVSDKPVVVLPITARSKEEAKFKSTKYSVKWLLEWCKKIAKMFSGAVIYKEEVELEQ